MNRSSIVSKSVTLLAAALVGVALLPESQAAAADDECPVTDVDYSVVGTLQIKDTQFGAADGVHPLGSGKARVRFERGADGATTAHLMSYDLDSHFTVNASFALWSTSVVTQSHNTIATSCEGATSGPLSNGDAVWSTPIGGYRSDGTIACDGNVCGKFGAPAPGSTPLHEVSSVKFRPFHFAADGKTFQMPFSQISHSDSPRQTSYLALAGREVARSCVPHAAASCQ